MTNECLPTAFQRHSIVTNPLLWEGFVTPILADSSAHPFPMMHSENRKLNGSDCFRSGLDKGTPIRYNYSKVRKYVDTLKTQTLLLRWRGF